MEVRACVKDCNSAAAMMGGLRARVTAYSIDLVETEPRATVIPTLVRFGVGESLVRGPFMLELQ
jgi:hypothetical protein